MIDGLAVEVEILLWRRLSKSLLDFINLGLRIFIRPRVREGKVDGVRRRVAKHVLESQRELVLVVVEIVDLGKDSTPLGLRARERSEDWLEALSVQLGLIVGVLECKSDVLALGYTLDGKIEPSLVAMISVRSCII